MGATGEVDFRIPSRVRTENLLRWDLSPKQIQHMSDKLITKTKKVYDAVGSLDLDSVTLNNTLKALNDLEAEYTVQRNMLIFTRHVSPSEKVRAASTYACEKLSMFDEIMRMRNDVYQRILALGLKVDKDLTAEDKRYMERLRPKKKNNKKENVVHLHKEKQDKIKCTSLTFSRDELGGLPENFLSSLETDGDKLKITLSYNNYFTTMKKCFVPETRKKVGKAFYLFCEENYADFVLEPSMAKSAKKVSIFLEELAHKLKPLGDIERTNLLKLKEKECRKRRLKFYGRLNERDVSYYMDQVKNQYGVDHNQLKKYFPLEVVTQGLLDICQDLLGLSFSLVHSAPVWHPDVTLYCVTDRSSGQTVGQFYLDLFPREGKDLGAGRAYCSLLQPGCLLSDGSRQMAVAAIVTEFSKPTADAPSLLKHGDVVTYFHEFGHAMHCLCAQVDYAAFSAFDTETDFEEVPSQMLENWAWEKEPLQRMSKHYKTGAPIPDDLLDKLIKSRLANIGMVYLKEIVKAKLDLALHTQTGLDPANECMRLSMDFLGVPALQGRILSAVRHQAESGSGARLYRYLWGEVLSMDMFYSRFKEEGIMNPKVGLDYRNCILKPGSSKNAEEMLKNFLGREPNQEAFLTFLLRKAIQTHGYSSLRITRKS